MLKQLFQISSYHIYNSIIIIQKREKIEEKKWDSWFIIAAKPKYINMFSFSMVSGHSCIMKLFSIEFGNS